MSYWFDGIKDNQNTIACPSCADNLNIRSIISLEIYLGGLLGI